MNTITATICGIRPLLMHNGQLADRLYPYTQQIKAITDKGSKNMTDSDHDRRDRLEWEGGLYWVDQVGPALPCRAIEACLQKGAAKVKKGKDFAAAVLLSETDVKIEYDGPRDKDKMYNDKSGRFVFREGIVVQKSRIFRVRPMIPTGWKATFTVEYDDSIVNESDIQKALINAGALIGLGDWRPRFGRFIVESFGGKEAA